ncbi:MULTISPECIES: NUDIX hydrolase [unclassified Nocardioides]|uniref:NUDIX domain-containing protein n=1 Tax=unclassified Nocardioides TaxID=2615069 RepID=UPI0000570E2C|nr:MULTISPECIES: NUDIX hydrolase [unclassified Nocardioides]ABL81990.1 NUDIX hydrolase [Nocardioides sp. JS614]
MPELADRPEAWPVEDSGYPYDGDGWVVKVRRDQVRRPGHPREPAFSRVVVEHPGAAVVLAVDDRDRVLCLWQYRHAVARNLVQLPAGLCDVDGEDAAEVARRELVEEAGFEADRWTHLASAYSSPGFTAEQGHYFLAEGLREVGRGDFRPEHEEAEMVVGWVPFAELHEAVVAGRLADAHLALAVLLTGARRH